MAHEHREKESTSAPPPPMPFKNDVLPVVKHKLPLYLQRYLRIIELKDPLPESGTEEYATLLYFATAAYLARESTRWLDPKYFESDNYAKHVKLHGARRTKTLKIGNDPSNPYEDVRGYTSKAFLPPMPWVCNITVQEVLAEATQQGSGPGGTATVTKTTAATVASTITHTTPYNVELRDPGGTNVKLPDSIRRLRSIELMNKEELVSKVLSYVGALPTGKIPCPPFAESDSGYFDSDEEDFRLELPAWSYDVDCRLPPLPENEVMVARWCDLAFNTATRLLHVSDEECRPWRFKVPGGGGSRNKLSDLSWMLVPEGKAGETAKEKSDESGDRETRMSLVVEIKQPGVLPLPELHNFVNLKSLPTYDEVVDRAEQEYMAEMAALREDSGKTPKRKAGSFKKVENVWAQIYDYCVVQGNFFFILTTYEYWIFGVFSADYESAKVSEPLPYDERNPSVLQYILFWTQSSRVKEGFYPIPRNPTLSTKPRSVDCLLVSNYLLYKARLILNLNKKLVDKTTNRTEPDSSAWREPKDESIALTVQRYAFNLDIPLVRNTKELIWFIETTACLLVGGSIRPTDLTAADISPLLPEKNDEATVPLLAIDNPRPLHTEKDRTAEAAPPMPSLVWYEHEHPLVSDDEGDTTSATNSHIGEPFNLMRPPPIPIARSRHSSSSTAGTSSTSSPFFSHGSISSSTPPSASNSPRPQGGLKRKRLPSPDDSWCLPQLVRSRRLSRNPPLTSAQRNEILNGAMASSSQARPLARISNIERMAVPMERDQRRQLKGGSFRRRAQSLSFSPPDTPDLRGRSRSIRAIEQGGRPHGTATSPLRESFFPTVDDAMYSPTAAPRDLERNGEASLSALQFIPYEHLPEMPPIASTSAFQCTASTVQSQSTSGRPPPLRATVRGARKRNATSSPVKGQRKKSNRTPKPWEAGSSVFHSNPSTEL